jgi:hypothetical protein
MSAAKYGYAHRKLREQWRIRVERGQVACAYCGRMIAPGDDWHLAHDPADATRYIGAAHARCNCNTTLEKRLHGRVRGGFRWRSAWV